MVTVSGLRGVIAMAITSVCFLPGVHAAGRRALRRGLLRPLAAGVLPRLGRLPRHHVLLHRLLLQGRAAALRPAGRPAAPRQPGALKTHIGICGRVITGTMKPDINKVPKQLVKAPKRCV